MATGTDPLMRDIMRENAEFFNDNLLVDDAFMGSLYQSGVLTDGMMESVEIERSQAKKRNALRQVIGRRGPKAPAAFLKALMVSEQPHVITQILRTRDSSKRNGAAQLMQMVKQHYGDVQYAKLYKIYQEDCH